MAVRISLALLTLSLLTLQVVDYFGGQELATSFVSRLDDAHAMPPAIVNVLDETMDRSSGGGPLRVALWIFVSAWLLSGALRAFSDFVARAYDCQQDRSVVNRWSMSFALALINLVVVGSAYWLAGYQTNITTGPAEMAWDVGRWLVAVALLLVAYHVTTRLSVGGAVRNRMLSVGAVLAVTLWVIFTRAYSAYYTAQGSADEVYGTFAGIAMLLLYAYYSSAVVLAAAIVNAQLARRAGSAARAHP